MTNDIADRVWQFTKYAVLANGSATLVIANAVFSSDRVSVPIAQFSLVIYFLGIVLGGASFVALVAIEAKISSIATQSSMVKNKEKIERLLKSATLDPNDRIDFNIILDSITRDLPSVNERVSTLLAAGVTINYTVFCIFLILSFVCFMAGTYVAIRWLPMT
jgi:hypothetical protein